jgi:hypothetical protein
MDSNVGRRAPIKRPTWDIEAIREYVADKAERSSIRAAAEAIGVQHSTLHSFIQGAMPHPRIRRVLVAWYAFDTSGEGAPWRDAVDVLVWGLPLDQQPVAERVLLDALAGVYHASSLEPPAWARRGRDGTPPVE